MKSKIETEKDLIKFSEKRFKTEINQFCGTRYAYRLKFSQNNVSAYKNTIIGVLSY